MKNENKFNEEFIKSDSNSLRVKIESILQLTEIGDENMILSNNQYLKEKSEIISILSNIIEHVTNERTLAFFLIQSNIVKKEKQGLVGTVIGGAIGGLEGAVVGNTVFNNQNSITFSGEIGILLFTEKDVIIKCFKTNLVFPYFITIKQLDELLKRIISNRDVSTYNFKHGFYNFNSQNGISGTGGYVRFEKSKILIDNSLCFQLKDDFNYISFSNKFQTFDTKFDCFINDLKNNICPMDETTYMSNIEENNSLLHSIITSIHYKYEFERKRIFYNFGCLIPQIVQVFEQKMQKEAKPYLIKLLFTIVLLTLTLAIVGLITGLLIKDGSNAIAYILFVPLLLIILQLIITFLEFSEARNWKKVIKQYNLIRKLNEH